MAHQLRVEYAGGAYHVMACGNQGRPIYADHFDGTSHGPGPVITLVPGTQATAESRHLGTVNPLPPQEPRSSRCESALIFPGKIVSRFTSAATVQGFSGPRQGEAPPLPKSAQEWASVLKMAWRAQTTTIIALARFFHAAKTGLSPGALLPRNPGTVVVFQDTYTTPCG